MEAKLIKMTHKDIDAVMEIIEHTKKIFKQTGIDQWQNGYPNRDSVLDDIASDSAYVIVSTGIVGYFALLFDPDPYYATIEGKWLNGQVYATVHRFVISFIYRGQGYASHAFKALENEVIKRGVNSIRVDTHASNRTMIHLVEKTGYSFCGKVRVMDGERLAFQKILSVKDRPLF